MRFLRIIGLTLAWIAVAGFACLIFDPPNTKYATGFSKQVFFEIEEGDSMDTVLKSLGPPLLIYTPGREPNFVDLPAIQSPVPYDGKTTFYYSMRKDAKGDWTRYAVDFFGRDRSVLKTRKERIDHWLKQPF